MPYITDRTSIEADEKCGQKRWWFLHEAGEGIVPVKEPLPLRDGIAIHEELAALLEKRELNLPQPPEDETDQEAMESWARMVGWLVAFHTWAWPEWFAPHYDIVAIEKEMVLDRGALWVAFTADIILRKKIVTDKKPLVVVDFKSVGWLTKEWAESWPFSIQMHLNQLGVEEEMEEAVSHAIVVGLSKGKWDDGKLRHPYVWAYSNGEEWSEKYTRANGWSLRPVWEYGSGGAEGVKEWVLRLGREIGLSQFPVSQPVVFDRVMAEDLLMDRSLREREVELFFKELGDDFDPHTSQRLTFPRRYSACRPSFGSPCPYLSACWNKDIGADPIGSGEYKRRTPHHTIEAD